MVFPVIAILISSSLACADDAEIGKIKDELDVLLTQKLNSDQNFMKGWRDHFVYTGLIQLESSRTRGFNDNKPLYDTSFANSELGVAVSLSKIATVTAIFLHEEGKTQPKMDVMTVHFVDEERTAFSLSIGKSYLLFGSFDTNLINDSLSLELAEVRANNIVIAYDKTDFTLAAYVAENSAGNNIGFSVGYGKENYSLGADYIDNIFTSELLGGGLENMPESAAFSVHGTAQFDSFGFIFEYLRSDAIKSLDEGSYRLAASQFEVDYQFEFFDMAIAYQHTRGTNKLVPQQRLSVGVSGELLDNLAGSIEFWHDRDFNVRHGGTGQSRNNINLQLRYTF